MVVKNKKIHFDIFGLQFLVAPAEAASAVDAQSVDDPPSARFTWTIDNFSRINTKKLYSDTFNVGGYKWYFDLIQLQLTLVLFLVT